MAWPANRPLPVCQGCGKPVNRRRANEMDAHPGTWVACGTHGCAWSLRWYLNRLQQIDRGAEQWA